MGSLMLPTLHAVSPPIMPSVSGGQIKKTFSLIHLPDGTLTLQRLLLSENESQRSIQSKDAGL